MTRKQAMRAEADALESLKLAAIDYARESSGGPEPLRAGALLRLAAKRYHAAAHAVVDAIMGECPEERAASEGVRPEQGRTIPSLVRGRDGT